MPKKPAQTLTALYRHITGDTTTHQRTIDAHFRKLDARRQAIIRARQNEQSYHVIAAPLGISAPSVRETFLRAIEKIRKAAADEPRFNHSGRPAHYSRKGTL